MIGVIRGEETAWAAPTMAGFLCAVIVVPPVILGLTTMAIVWAVIIGVLLTAIIGRPIVELIVARVVGNVGGFILTGVLLNVHALVFGKKAVSVFLVIGRPTKAIVSLFGVEC